MSVAGRFLVRLATYAGFGVLIGGVFILLFSDLPRLSATGVLGLLFLFSRLRAWNSAERSLAKLSTRHPNIVAYFAPSTERILEKVADFSSVRGGEPVLNLIKILIEDAEIKKILLRLDVNLAAFSQKINSYLLLSVSKSKLSREEIYQSLQEVAAGAFLKATKTYAPFVNINH